MLRLPQDPKVYRHLHAALTLTWALLIIPSVLWWSDAIWWVVLMSAWANMAAHFSAWQGTRAEESGTTEP